MAMICIHGGECTGCMSCQEEEKHYCPICGEEVCESVYVSNDNEIVGCENCISERDRGR